MSTNEKNVYTCEKCRKDIVTVDREDGTTPFMLECKATAGCDGVMRSHMYTVDQGLRPDWEWYKPASLKGLDDWTRDHVKRGGLVLARIPANDHGITDVNLRNAVEFIADLESVSAISLQRKFKLTYMAAAKILDGLVKRRFLEAGKDRMGRHLVIKRETNGIEVYDT